MSHAQCPCPCLTCIIQIMCSLQTVVLEPCPSVFVHGNGRQPRMWRRHACISTFDRMSNTCKSVFVIRTVEGATQSGRNSFAFILLCAIGLVCCGVPELSLMANRLISESRKKREKSKRMTNSRETQKLSGPLKNVVSFIRAVEMRMTFAPHKPTIKRILPWLRISSRKLIRTPVELQLWTPHYLLLQVQKMRSISSKDKSSVTKFSLTR